MSSVTDRMLSRFAVVYGEPRTGDLEAFFGEYEKAMRGTRLDILDAATDQLLKTHEKRSWPTIGECRKAIDAVATDLEAKKNAAHGNKQETITDLPKPSAESKARVRAMLEDVKASMAPRDEKHGGSSLGRVDRDAWDSRKLVGVTRHGNPIRKGGG